MLPTHGEVSLFGGRKASVPAKSEDAEALAEILRVYYKFIFFLTLILLEFIILSNPIIRFYGQAAPGSQSASLTRDNTCTLSAANATTARRGNTFRMSGAPG